MRHKALQLKMSKGDGNISFNEEIVFEEFGPVHNSAYLNI